MSDVHETESRWVSARTLDRITWAARYAQPLPAMPPAHVRSALRRAVGVPRHVVAAAIGASYQPFVLSEQGKVKHSRLLVSAAYLRVLGYMAAVLKEQDEELYRSIMEGTASDAP